MKKTTAILAALTVTAALGLTGCVAGEDAPPPAAEAELGADGWSADHLNIDFATYNPLSLVIKEKGWLEEELSDEGVTVNWVQSAGSNKANEALRAEAGRTTYLLDVRDPTEFAAGHMPGAINAPGGQLVQATDNWVAVRGARIVLLDDTGTRAAMPSRCRCAWQMRSMSRETSVSTMSRTAFLASTARENAPVPQPISTMLPNDSGQRVPTLRRMSR